MKLSLIVALSLVGCGAGYTVDPNYDAGHKHRDASIADTNKPDLGTSHPDSSSPIMETGTLDTYNDVGIDAGLPIDASNDVGHPDVRDTGTTDIGTSDAKACDVGVDTGVCSTCTSLGQDNDNDCDQSEKDCVSSCQSIDNDEDRWDGEDNCHRDRNDCCVASCMNCLGKYYCVLSLSDCETACGFVKP